MEEQTWATWLLANWANFKRDLPYTALNSVLFASLFGWVTAKLSDYFRHRNFRAVRATIAQDAGDINQELMRVCKAVFDAIAAKDVEAYKKAKSESSTFQNSLNKFLTDYAPHFTNPTQAATYKHYKGEAEEVVRRLDWGKITSAMQENEVFKLEAMAWLFDSNRFGPLSKERFATLEHLMSDFIKTLGLSSRERKNKMGESKVEAAAKALKELKDVISNATGQTFAIARPRNIFGHKAAE